MTAESVLVRSKACAPGRVPLLAPPCYATDYQCYIAKNVYIQPL